MSDPLHQVERTADRIRDSLLLTLEELERRRQRLNRPKEQLLAHRESIAWGGAGLAATLASWFVWRQRPSARVQRLRRERWRALKRAWFHPKALAPRRAKPSRSTELTERLFVALAKSMAMRVFTHLIGSSRDPRAYT
jgi:hypothetical protein